MMIGISGKKFTVLEEKEEAKVSNSNADCAKDLSNEKILLSGICLQFTASPDVF